VNNIAFSSIKAMRSHHVLLVSVIPMNYYSVMHYLLKDCNSSPRLIRHLGPSLRVHYAHNTS